MAEHSASVFLALTYFWIGYVCGEIVWNSSMDNFKIEENQPFDNLVYTLLAINTPGNSSSDIIYGFNNKEPSDITISETSTFFRINQTTGNVYTYGNKLDYESSASRDFKVYLIAKLKDGSLASKRVSTVTLINVNDEKPIFVNGSLTVQIPENTPVDLITGTVYLQNILVTDADGLLSNNQQFIQATVQYCIIRGKQQPCTDTFALTQTGISSSKSYTGNFVIKKMLDYETASKIQVQLLATDGLPANDATTDIVINVIDVQDMPPIWLKIPAISRVYDGTLPGQLQIEIQAEDQDTDKRHIFYSFAPGQTPYGIPIEKIFQISSSMGILTNIVTMDLENETYFRNYAAKEVRSTWSLKLNACEIINGSVTPMVIGNTSNECIGGEVEVLILDVNDNAPTFDKPLYGYEIYENAPNGLVLDNPVIEITDRDTDAYNVFKTQFLKTSYEFEVTGASNRNPAIAVKNSSLLDYDDGPRVYNLKLQTYDIQNTSLSSIADITITILDVNDNWPVFQYPAYYKSISEISQEGTNVERILATDRDSGDFGTDGIEYSLGGPYQQLFKIDELSGQVTVAWCATYGTFPCLDYDVLPRRYDVIVYATDSRKTRIARKQSSVNLLVEVQDVNDNPPTVPNYERDILEGQRSFTPNLFVKGEDKDSNTVLQYAMQSQSPNNFWAIDSSTGRIYVQKPNNTGIRFQDGDASGMFHLTVTVTDGKYTATSFITINIVDTNDNAPIFIPSYYETSINETTPGDTSILQISATDADDPNSDNGRLEYNIMSGNAGGRFNLIQANGSLYVARGAVFDFNLKNRYEMIAVANDKGTPQLSGSCTIVINILDTNNKNPSVDPFLQEFSVLDNAPIGYTVGKIHASDPDQNAVLKYVIEGKKEANSDEGYPVDPAIYDFTTLFRVDSATGKIFTNGTLNSRMTNVVSYGVKVYDTTPSPWQSGPGTIVIFVKPFNKYGPVFENFTTPVYVDEELPIGSVIISLIANDDNGIQGYTITQQPDDYFSIVPTAGAVTVTNRIDYDDARKAKSTYIIVEVVDTGQPQLTATASVTVSVRNINDNYPEFVENNTQPRVPVSLYLATIPENSPDGTFIATAYAFDADWPDAKGYNIVRYYMNDDRFDVDNITGRIVVRLRNGAVLDRELTPRILSPQVIARDNPAGPPSNQKQRVATVQVTLTDVNDNPPVFSQSNYYVTIYETINVNTEILQLFTTDPDLGDNAISYYSKIPNAGDDINDFFDVRKDLGRVYVKSSLVHNVGVYLFYVKAQDKLGTGFITNCSVTVTVRPSANSPPVWVIPPIDNMTIYVLEEQYKGMLVYDVSARDVDTGVNGIVDYSFIYNGEQTQNTSDFRINMVTGVIRAEIVYDREKVDRYVLLLKAKDRGETPLETTRFLTVVILDVNDNAPKFPKLEISFRIKKNSPVDLLIGEVQATDIDLNPIIYYDIIAGNENGIFKLGRYNGSLTLAKSLIDVNQSAYYLDIQASNGEPDSSVIQNRKKRSLDASIVTVTVLVGDVNTLAPVFLNDKYYGCISSRAPYDTQILTIQAKASSSGIVRYLIASGNTDGDKILFAIHERLGIITNKLLMKSYVGKTFVLQVNARDGESINNSPSANVDVLAFVSQPENEVKLLITQNTAEVNLYKSQIQNIIEQANDLDYVCITDVQDHVISSAGDTTTLWSDVYLAGIRKLVNNGQTNYTILSATEFANIIERERYSHKSDFDLLYIRSVQKQSSSWEVPLQDKAVMIIMIIIIVLVFLVIVFCIIAFLCIRMAKSKKKARLVHKTFSEPVPIMVQQEPTLFHNHTYIEVPPKLIVEQKVVEPDPVHVQYAVVQKQPLVVNHDPSVYDDQEAIMAELLDDDNDDRDHTNHMMNVDDDGNEYRIETELVTDQY